MSSHLAKIVLTLAMFAAAFAGHQWWLSRDSGTDHIVTERASVRSEDLLQSMEESVAELAKLAEQFDNVGQIDVGQIDVGQVDVDQVDAARLTSTRLTSTRLTRLNLCVN